MHTARASRALAPQSRSALTAPRRSRRYVIIQLIADCESPAGPCAGTTVSTSGSTSRIVRSEAA